jgi:hypothetical protein
MVTVLDLKPDSQDALAFHLNNIQQNLADMSRASIPSDPTPFSPPISAVWVNTLLFLSLVISITCALLAVLLYRYLWFILQLRDSLHKRARTRAFFSHAAYLSVVAEALPTLNISLDFFFAGLLIWLFSKPVFHAVGWAILSAFAYTILSAFAYIWITFLPIIWAYSQFYPVLSPTILFLYTGIPYVILVGTWTWVSG